MWNELDNSPHTHSCINRNTRKGLNRLLGLSNKVDDDQVEEQVGNDEISKSSFLTDIEEQTLILRVDLNPKTNCKQKYFYIF